MAHRTFSLAAVILLGIATGCSTPPGSSGTPTVRVRAWGPGMVPLPGAAAVVVTHRGARAPVFTDEDGFADVPFHRGEELPSWIMVTAPGYASRLVATPGIDAEEGRTLRIDLEPGILLKGVVRDAATGMPLPRALVTVREDGPGEVDCLMPRYPIAAESRSGPGGDFEVGPVDGGSTWRLRVEAAGSAPREMVLEDAYGSPIVLAMAAGVALRGIVRDAAGRPVEGATVAADIVDDDDPDGTASPFPVTTDSAGRFEIHGLARGRKYRVHAEGKGFSDVWLDDALEVALAAPAVLSRDMVLRRPVPVTIRVRGPDGAEVPEAEVTVDSPNVLATGRTSVRDGCVSFEMPAGPMTITVKSPRFGHRTVKADATEGTPLTVEVVMGEATR